VANCGGYLVFRVPAASAAAPAAAAGKAKAAGAAAAPARLHTANFCRERLCPMCAWRRSLKIFANISEIINHLNNKYRFLFLTLTVRNVQGSDLSSTIDRMNDAIKRMFRYLRVVKGYVRVLEITRNSKDGSYHPHLHMVLAVLPSYFTGEYYIDRDKWLQMWQVAYGDPNITQVDIRAARDKHTGKVDGDLSSSVAEIAKYSCKPSEFLFPSDLDLTDDIVRTLDGALYHRRLLTLSGVFLQASRELQQDDPENGDLVHINDDAINPDLAYMLYRYQWSAGVYKLMGKEELSRVP
jgi:plasmid rolling circle replication initiator protein Rep